MSNFNTIETTEIETTEVAEVVAVVDPEVQLKQEYNEYVLEAKTNGTAIITFHQFKARKIGFSNLIKPKADVPVSEAPVSKASIARQIFAEGKATGMLRKDIIKLFQSQAGLTPAGAATYYANFMEKWKKENPEQVIKSAPVVTPVNAIPNVGTEADEIDQSELEAAAALYDKLQAQNEEHDEEELEAA